MSLIRHLPAQRYVVMPWKNGGGETTEIAISPEGATLDTFSWRISMATVRADGPFSAFAGIDRTLSVLDGRGLRLDVTGREPVTLTAECAPYSFPGDAPTTGQLIDGAVLDFNVMSRRGLITHAVEDIGVDGHHECAISGGNLLVFAADGDVTVTCGTDACALGLRDAALLATRDAPKVAIATQRARRVILVTFRACT